MMRVLILSLVLVFALPLHRAAAITYDLGLLSSGTSVTGTVETNGTIGTLSTSDIVDWTITVDNGTDSFTLIGDGQAGDNSDVFIDGTSVSATLQSLRFDFNGTGFLLFQAPAIGSGDTFFCVQNIGCSGVIDDTYLGNPTTESSDIFSGPVFSGNAPFASNPEAAPVPSPASGLLLLVGVASFRMLRRLRSPATCTA